MRSRKRNWVTVAAAAVSAAVSTNRIAPAGLVAPGQTVHQARGDAPQFQFSESMLSGLVPAQLYEFGSTFFTVVDGPPGTVEAEFPSVIDVSGRWNSSVHRDPSTRGVSFLYRFEVDAEFSFHSTADARVDLRGFGSFTTDIFFGNGLDFDITRSASGDQISLHAVGGNVHMPDVILIGTNAQKFSEDSSMDLHTADLFQVEDATTHEFKTVPLAGDITVFPTFAPAPGVIPLPPAALPAMGMLVALAAIGTWRRRRHQST